MRELEFFLDTDSEFVPHCWKCWFSLERNINWCVFVCVCIYVCFSTLFSSYFNDTDSIAVQIHFQDYCRVLL